MAAPSLAALNAGFTWYAPSDLAVLEVGDIFVPVANEFHIECQTFGGAWAFMATVEEYPSAD